MTGKKTREPITELRERLVIDMIINWDPTKKPLTREALTRRVNCSLGFSVTRQGLMKRDAIRDAYNLREKEITGDKPARADKEPFMGMLERQIENLKREATSKDKEITGYKELFVRIRHNARQMGIAMSALEAPVPRRTQPEETEKR